ncbi:hypothetical protein B0H14DRAFT_3882878 [Mycena olivaceomarginata]|nr:hypothetical protein B0H14DRAFT_3882878 [Mycena olivaceomarginata]
MRGGGEWGVENLEYDGGLAAIACVGGARAYEGGERHHGWARIVVVRGGGTRGVVFKAGDVSAHGNIPRVRSLFFLGARADLGRNSQFLFLVTALSRDFLALMTGCTTGAIALFFPSLLPSLAPNDRIPLTLLSAATPAYPFAMPMTAPTMSPNDMLRAYAAKHASETSTQRFPRGAGLKHTFHLSPLTTTGSTLCPTNWLLDLAPSPILFLFLAHDWAHCTQTSSLDPHLQTLYGFEVVHREDGADDDQWSFKRASPFRSLLPRIWDISASPPRELIDDEACFFCQPARAVTGIDILTLLPPELSLHILNLLSPTWPDPRAPAPVPAPQPSSRSSPAALSLAPGPVSPPITLSGVPSSSPAGVSRLRPSPHPRTSSLAAARMMKLPPLPPDAASPLPLTTSPAPTPSWRALYRARLTLERRRGSPAVTNEIAWQPPACVLSGHADSVYCLEFSRSHIFTGSCNRAVKVWSVRTGRLLGTFAGGHRGSVLCLKFDDCTMCVWDLWTESTEEDTEVHAEVRAVLRGHGGACSIGALIGGGSGHEGPVNAVGLESGEYDDADAKDKSEGDVGYGEGNKSQRHEGRVDIKSGEQVRTFEGHDRGLACIEFKGDLIISGSNDCKIKIWFASTGACLRTLVGHEALMRTLAFDPSSGCLVSASYNRSVWVWDLGALCGAGSGGAAGASAGGGSGAMRVVRDSHTSHIFDVKFDGRRIVSTSHDQKIVILDFSAGLGVDADFVV